MLLASILVSVSASAQWTKPSVPTAQALSVGDECYLLNIDAEGFLVGANEWGTRASVDPTHGHKIYIQKFEGDDVTWDGESYFITNYVEQGGSAGNIMAMDFTSTTDIWMDRTPSVTATNQGFMFKDLGDNIYKIGFAKVNEESYSYEGAWYDAWLGVIPEMEDTRLYVCLPGSDTYDENNYQVRWIFLTPDDYTTYSSAMEQYLAAVELGEAIEEAKSENNGIDLSEVEAVYNNTSSTADELTEALQRTTDLVIAFQTASASATTPANYTPLITNASYDDDESDGWSGTSATVDYGVAEIYSWDANTFDYYQTISSLPQGVYRVGVTGFYRSGTNAVDCENYLNGAATQYVTLYATGGGQTNTAPLPLQHSGVSSTSLGGSTYSSSLGYVPNSMEAANIYFEAGQYTPAQTLISVDSEGTLTIGLQKTQSATDNWAIWDNWTLEYLGAGSDAYQLLTQQTLDAATDYEEMVASGEIEFYDHNAYDDYLAAVAALKSASTAEEVASAITAFETAVSVFETSVEAYSNFNTQYQEAEDWLTSQGAATDETDALAEFLDEAIDVLQNGELTADEINAQATVLSQLLYDAMASGMSDGDDCTSMLQNASLTTTGGWTSAVGPTWPVDDNPVGEAQNMVCDVYQELTGLQNGLYEFSTYDVYRAQDAGSVTGNEEFKAYIYINSYKKKMNGLLDGQSATSLYSDDYQLSSGQYVPNSAAGASAFFQAGYYKQTVYGLVTDGTMRIGYRNDLRYADGSRLWWGPATLVFRAKNAEALREATDMSLAEAEEMLTYICGQPEIDALNDAIAEASDATGDDIYTALVALKSAMADVDTCTTAYSNFLVALAQLEDAIATVEASEEDLAEAQSVLDDANVIYDNRTLGRDDVEALTESINSLVVSLKLGASDEASEENPQDVSDLIVNNTFDPTRGDKSTSTIEGWTTSALNGYKEYTASYNRAAIDLYQDLSGLPEGTYKVTVHTYYRAGYYNEEEERVANGEETHLTTLYAQTSDDTYSTPVMNLYEGATETLPDGVTSYYTLSDGKYAPDGTTASATYFAAGYYLNELTFLVPEDGEVTIGLEKTEVLSNDYEVVGEWNLYYMGDPDAGLTKQDVSSLIVNNTFDPLRGDKSTSTIEGWTTSALNGYKEYTASYNRAAIDLYQDLSGLPEGTYKVTVHTYYRAGYYNEEEERVANGEETHLTTLYAQTSDDTYSTPVMNLYEGATETLPDGVTSYYTLSDGKYAPDGTTASAAYFTAGYYLNELPFYVGSDGKARIGLKKDEILANDYEVVGEWNLYYYGTGNNLETLTGVENTAVAPVNAVSVGIYNLQGQRVQQLQRGVNIIKMEDGTVRKVIVK